MAKTDEIIKNINDPNETNTETSLTNNDNYHVRAGRKGGQSTKRRFQDSEFYREIGSKGGSVTMSRHSEEYRERRKKGGETTRERYGDEYYHEIAAKAARSKQENTLLRNEAIKVLLAEGFKIPTIIKLTTRDLESDLRLKKHLESGPLADYLKEKPATDNDYLFVSQSGKQLSLANTYTVMSRHKA
jgi:general stress protein YciG